MRRSRRRTLVAVLALLAGAAPAAAAPREPLGHAGRWITDADGRVVVLHGFNTVPLDETLQPKEIGLAGDAVRWLSENGFNVVRLGLYYARVEPAPGAYDTAYLDDYLRAQGELAAHGVFTLLDMHQDQLNRQFGGGPVPGTLPSRGFPDWFVRTDGIPSTDVNYPSGYLGDPALNRAYDNLWNDFPAGDGTSVQSHFARGWQLVIERFRDRSHLLGYDLFNEPWPGSAALTCSNPAGCPPGGFDQTLLSAFTKRIAAAAAAADSRHLVFYEPNLLFDFGAATGVSSPGIPNAGFTFHDYCLGSLVPSGQPSADQCHIDEAMTMDNADAQAQRTGDALLLGEAGFDPPAATRIAALADEHMVSWTFWDYYPAGLIFRDQWPILIRPYPQLVSGTPASWGFDLASKNFTLRYATRRVAGGRFPAGSRTEVLLPRLQYPHGYRLAVSGADIASQPTAGRLVLCSAPGASDVALTVTPSGSGVTDLPAGPGRDVGCPGDSGEAATSVTGGAGPISVSGTTVSIPGSGTVRLPPSGRCLRGRTIQVRLRLARGTHLVGAAATINGRARGVHVGRGGRLSIRVGRGRSTRVTLRLRLRVRTRHGTRTIRITRRYRICGSA